jgi:hypothetical protein
LAVALFRSGWEKIDFFEKIFFYFFKNYLLALLPPLGVACSVSQCCVTLCILKKGIGRLKVGLGRRRELSNSRNKAGNTDTGYTRLQKTSISQYFQRPKSSTPT